MKDFIATPSTSPSPSAEQDPDAERVRPELGLLLAISCGQDDVLRGIDPKQIDSLDWRWLVDACGRNKLILPLLKIMPDLPGAPPKWVRPSLWVRKRRFQVVAQRHVHELCRLTGLMKRDDIDFRAMRGPVLSQFAFDAPDRREISDLDILVRRQDLDRTKALLTGCGYRGFESEFRVEENRALQMSNPRLNVGLDLHWSAVPEWLPVGSNFDAMQRPPLALDIGGCAVPTLPREETILVQLIQCVKSGWQELDRWHDLAVLCERWRDLDWDRIVSVCDEHGYLNSLALTLRLLGPKSHENIPTALRQRLPQGPNLQNAERVILQRLSEPVIKQRTAAYYAQTLALTRNYVPFWLYALVKLSGVDLPIAQWWLVMDDGKYRWRFALWFLVPTTTDHQWVELPKGLHGLYYLVRPIRLLYTRLRSHPGRARPG